MARKQASRTARFPGPFYKMRLTARKLADADIDIRTIQATLEAGYNRFIARRTLRRWLEGGDELELQTRLCPACGTPFTMRQGNQRTCGKSACREKLRYWKAHPQESVIPEIRIEDLGSDMEKPDDSYEKPDELPLK